MERQILWDLYQLRLDEQRVFNQRLDKEHRERDAAQREALAVAAAEHDKVRREAELFQERVLIEEQLRREIEYQKQVQDVERLRQEAAQKQLALEKERTQALKATVAAEQAANEERQARAKAAEQSRLAKEQREAEAARAAAEEKERQRQAAEAQVKAKEEAEKAARARAQAALASKAPTTTPTPVPTLTTTKSTTTTPTPPLFTSQPSQPSTTTQAPGTERGAERRRYLEIHQNLKKLRNFMMNEAKKAPDLKKKMGEHRREIRKRVGQLTGENKKNTEPMRVVRDLLKDALTWSTPQVNVLDYLYSPPDSKPDPNGPGLFLYLLNIFTKSIILQFLNEASVSPKTADPVGIIGSSVFAQPDFQWNGISLVDILLAKFHVKCPVLFGIYGDERTVQGKERLGWQRENGAFVSDQRQAERMTGLGAGFAALTLRSFAKSKLNNPLPTWHFWRAMASIVNVPPEQVTVTHFYVLKALIEHNVARILEFFGNAGLAALNKAVVDFATKGKLKDHVAARSVALLKDIFAREEYLYL